MKINTLPQPGNSVLRFSHRFLVAALAFCLCLDLAPAQSLQWDANGTTAGVTDGAGTWNLTNQNWSNGATTDVWNNNGSTIAVFGNGSNASAATITVSGTVNAGGLTFQAVGTVSSPTPNYGSYTLSGGTISLADGAFIRTENFTSFTTGSTRLTITSALAGSNITFAKSGSETAFFTISGNNTWTGTLTLANVAGGGGTFLNVSNLNSLKTLNAIDVQAGSSLILGFGGSEALNVPLSLSGTGAGSRGAIRFDQNYTVSGPITLTGNAGVSVNVGNANLVGTVAGNIGETGGSRSLTINASSTAIGTIVLSGNNTFTGGVILNAGGLRLGSANALNASGVNTLTFATNTVAKTFTLNGFSTTMAGIIQQGTTDVVTIENASATAATLTVANTANATFRGTLADGTGGGALTLVKTGSGTQTLSGTANTYTGGTVLNGGILNIAADGSLGAVPSTVDPDNLTFNGGTLQFAYAGSQASPSLNVNRGITLLAGGGTLDTLANDTYYAGAITGAGSLTKNGTGLLILAGASDYSGETLITAGNLEIRHALALGSTAGGTSITNTSGRLNLSGGLTVVGESLISPYLASVAGNNTWTGSVQAAIGATLTFDAASGTQLNISGNVNAADTGGSAHSFNLVGSGTGVISGNISNALTVTKSGTGAWTLSGNNTFTNGVALSQGELILGSYGALNSAAPNVVTFSASANTKTLSLQGTSSIVGGLVSTSATGVTTQNGGTTDATLTIQTSATRTYLGALADGSGGGKLSLLKTGSGTQVLGSASTYTGSTTVAAGTLQLDFNQTGAPASQILGSSTALILSGGTFSLTGSSTAANAQTVQSLTVGAGLSTISLTRNATTAQDLVLNLGNITTQNGGRVNFILPSGTQSATNGIRTTSSNDASGILGGWATVGGNNWATVSGGNIVAYSAYTDITNFSTGAGAVTPLPNNANANVRIINGGTSGNIALESTTTNINTLLQTATGEAIIDVPTGSLLRLGTSGGIMLGTGAGNLTIGTTPNSGNLSAGGTTTGTPGQLIFTDQSAGQTTTVNTAIRDNGTGIVSLVKNGPGLLILGATTNSTFTGATYINGGTVRISADSSLGTAPASAVSGHLTLNGGTLQMAASFTLSTNRGILLGENGGTLDLQTFNTTYSGIISGVGGLTKNGNGTLTLGGANTYDGVTTVNAGTVQVNHSQALGSTLGGTTVASAAILRLNTGVTVTGETLTINGPGNNQGNLQVQTGTATWAGDIILGSNTGRIGTGSSTGILIIDGVIKNGAGTSISYVGNGGGIVVLKKANTYTGNSDIIRGIVRIDTDNALPATTTLNMLTNTVVTESVALELNGNDQTLAGLKHGVVSVVDNVYVTNSLSGAGNLSVLTLNQANSTTYSGRIEGNLALVKDGSATLTLTNTYNLGGTTATATQSTYTGKTTIRAGTLALSGTGNISGTPWIQVDQGATFSISGRTSGNYTLNGQILSGRGNVNGNLIIAGSSGYVSAGDSTGSLLSNAGNGLGELTFENLTLAGGTPTLRALFQLGDTNSTLSDLLSGGDPAYFANADSGGLYDSIQVNGTLSLNAGSTLRVELLGSYVPTAGDVFNLLDWVNPLNTDGDGAGGAGAFTLADLDLSSANAILSGSGFVFNTDYFMQHGVIYIAVIPEPSRALFLMLGLIAFISRRRRRA
ncbi:beta strand repeat-containing protein [Prosthecobacter debontii]|nr:autotransporter-associated beta strand repeat-containing protein [Prosthecobacter debontii]